MPFDPTLPVNSANVKAAELRAQFAGLKELIDAVPAVTAASVDSVTTLDPGDSATADAVLDGTALRFTFSIPRGGTGGTGADGPPGAPGEVTNAALAAAIAAALESAAANSSASTNAVPTLDAPFANDPPTLADLETLRAAYNALVLAQRR